MLKKKNLKKKNEKKIEQNLKKKSWNLSFNNKKNFLKRTIPVCKTLAQIVWM